jgi:hypothetical protein
VCGASRLVKVTGELAIGAFVERFHTSPITESARVEMTDAERSVAADKRAKQAKPRDKRGGPDSGMARGDLERVVRSGAA